MNYLELVNGAIRESGQDLDQLTVANFATPDDPYHERWKIWINQAYKDILNERKEWLSLNRKVLATIYPRIRVDQGFRPAPPPSNSQFVGQQTGTVITVLNVWNITGSWLSGTAEAFFDLDDIAPLSGTLLFGDIYNEVIPNPLNLNVFRIKGWGRYNFTEIAPDYKELRNNTIYIRDPSNTSNSSMTPLIYVPWDEWNYRLEVLDTRSTPQYFTESPDGYLDLWPRPDKKYLISFYYVPNVPDLTLPTDIPTNIPTEYHEAILWRAVMYYADFDHQQSVYMRARSRFLTIKNRLERDNMPPPSWTPSMF